MKMMHHLVILIEVMDEKLDLNLPRLVWIHFIVSLTLHFLITLLHYITLRFFVFLNSSATERFGIRMILYGTPSIAYDIKYDGVPSSIRFAEITHFISKYFINP